MLTSAQVAALMAQQNQAFTGMQQYSQVISAQMPQPYGSIGSYGMQGPTSPQFAQVPYAPRQMPGFSYAGSPFGYGMGNQFGAAGVSAMGGAGQFALGAAGIAGGLGLLGRTGSMLLDPISAGMAGFSAARGVGMGMMGGLGVGGLAAGAVAAPMMFAQHALGSMVTGAQEQAGVNQAMGQYNFSNPMSRSGRGFSRQDSMAIGSVVREMQSIPEMMTSMSELTRILDRMGQSGMMQGVRDATEFGKRFKETVRTLKDISKMMGSTMEEAMQAFQESKQAGFYSPDAIKQNIMQRQIVGGLTGMNQQQVGALQAYGAQGSFQAGGSRAGGARGITRIAGELGMANQMGLLSNERLMEMTGEEGAAGIQQLAGTLNDVGQRMGRSSLGTAMTLALGEQKDGRYTGGMDQDLVQRVRSGQIGKNELLRIAHEKSRTRGAKLSFAAHRQRLTTEMVNSAGAQGVAMELSTILGERGFDNPDALNLVMQRYGVGEREANQVIELMKEMPNIQRGMGEAGIQESRRMAEQAFMRENASFEGIRRKIGKKMENVLTEPFKKMGASISNSISESVDQFVDEIFGRYQTKVTNLASDTVMSAQMGNRRAQQLVQSVQPDVTARRRSGVDLRNDSLLGGAMNALSGQQGVGEIQSNILKSMGGQYYDTIQGTGNDAADRARILGRGGDILSSTGGTFTGGEFTVSTAGGRAQAIKALQGANPLQGKIDTTKGPGRALLGQLRNELLSNEELRNPDTSDARKLEMLQSSLEATGIWQGADSGDVLNQLKKQLGTDNVADVIDALAQQGGLGNQMGMFSRRGLAKGLQGVGSAKELSRQTGDAIKKAAGGFGDREAEARSVFEQGGATAKMLAMAFGGGKQGQALQVALGEREGSAVNKDLLDALGISQKEFDASREQGRGLVAAGRQGGAVGSDIQDVLNKQLVMAQLKNTDRQKEIGQALTDRVAQASGLTAAGQDISKRLGAFGSRLTNEGGFGELGGETGSLAVALADYKGKDRSEVLRLAGAELQGGAQEVEVARQRYRRAKGGGPGGKSLEALGYTSEGLAKMGITGQLNDDLLKQIQGIAGGDKFKDRVSGDEEKKIEAIMGDLRTRSLATSKGAEQNTVAASKSLQDYFEKSTKNMDRVATLLEGLVTTQKGGKPA